MHFRIDVCTRANSCLNLFLAFEMFLLLFIIIVFLHVHFHLQKFVVVEAVRLLAFFNLIQVFLNGAADFAGSAHFIGARPRQVRSGPLLRGSLAILGLSKGSRNFRGGPIDGWNGFLSDIVVSLVGTWTQARILSHFVLLFHIGLLLLNEFLL